jgi:hypothetical protein
VYQASSLRGRMVCLEHRRRREEAGDRREEWERRLINKTAAAVHALAARWLPQ